MAIGPTWKGTKQKYTHQKLLTNKLHRSLDASTRLVEEGGGAHDNFFLLKLPITPVLNPSTSHTLQSCSSLIRMR